MVPSGPVQACNGIALTFYLLIYTVPFRTFIPLIILSVAVLHFVPYFVPLYCFGSSSICFSHVINVCLLLALFLIRHESCKTSQKSSFRHLSL